MSKNAKNAKDKKSLEALILRIFCRCSGQFYSFYDTQTDHALIMHFHNNQVCLKIFQASKI